jgi:acetolactate synthase-1/2/3 large subunit
MQLTGGEAVVKSLENQGIEVAFGMVGHGNLAILDALLDSNIRFISVPHEQIATHAADAYFRVTHKPAVVLTTVGPGATNTMTALADALLDSSAIVVLCGGIPSFYSGMDALQELGTHHDDEQFEMFKPVTKRVWKVAHARQLPHVISRAFNYALTGNPGPVVVHVPLDFYSKRLDYDLNITGKKRITSSSVLADPGEVKRALDLLIGAERPLIYAGNGTLLSEAAPALTQLAEYLQIPVATTMSGQGAISGEHPLAAGFTGTVGTPTANRLAREADVILAIGTRMPEMDSNSWKAEHFFAIPPAQLIHVDLNPHEIGKIFPVEVGVVGDANAVLNQLTAVAKETTASQSPSAWVQGMQQQRDSWWAELEASQASDEVPISVGRLLGDIRQVLPPEGIFISGVGVRHSVGQHIRFQKPMTHIVGSGYGTMGQEVPAALGAKLGKPDVPVVAAVGDGAFRSTMQTLLPAVEYGINAIWVVQNNYSFNVISLYQKRHWERLIGTEFIKEDENKLYNPDFAALAHAFGAGGRRVERPEDLKPALEEAIQANRPYVLDVIMTQQPRIRATGYWVVNDIINPGWSGEPV